LSCFEGGLPPTDSFVLITAFRAVLVNELGLWSIELTANPAKKKRREFETHYFIIITARPCLYSIAGLGVILVTTNPAKKKRREFD
jgi:hypothetical protein